MSGPGPHRVHTGQNWCRGNCGTCGSVTENALEYGTRIHKEIWEHPLIGVDPGIMDLGPLVGITADGARHVIDPGYVDKNMRRASMPNNFGTPPRTSQRDRNGTLLPDLRDYSKPMNFSGPHSRGPVLYDGLNGTECLRRFTANQRADGDGTPLYLLTPAQKEVARSLWSASLRVKVEASASKDAERERNQVVCDDPDYYGTENA